MGAANTASADNSHKSPLHQAAKAGDLAGLARLLDAGADPNEIGWQGATALHHVAGRALTGPMGENRQACLKLLLSAGADVTITAGNGGTALHAAAWPKEPETILTLYNAGADLSAKDDSDRTVLDVCMEYQNYQCVLALRAVGESVQSHAHGALTMRQASVLAGLTERLNHLLDHCPPESAADTPLALAEFAAANSSQSCAALLQARIAQHQLASIRGIADDSSVRQWDTWSPEGVSSSARMFNRSLIEANSPVDYKSREKLIEIPIDDFLALSKHEVAQSKLTRTRSITRQAAPIRELPFLQVAPSDDDPTRLVVDGHEGRHRARALAELGFKTMPVLLRAAHIRWSEQSDPARWDYRSEWPTSIHAERGAKDQTFSIVMPVARETAAQAYPIDRLCPMKPHVAKTEKKCGSHP